MTLIFLVLFLVFLAWAFGAVILFLMGMFITWAGRR